MEHPLFENNCAACHHPENNGVGPALKGVRDKWEKEAETEGLIYTWVRNFDDAVKVSSYAAKVAASRPDKMNAFPALTNEEIERNLRLC